MLILRLAHVLVYLLVVVAAEVRAILDEVAVFVAGSNVGKVD